MDVEGEARSVRATWGRPRRDKFLTGPGTTRTLSKDEEKAFAIREQWAKAGYRVVWSQEESSLD